MLNVKKLMYIGGLGGMRTIAVKALVVAGVGAYNRLSI